MENSFRPDYRLAEVEEYVVACPGTQPFTATALAEVLALGMTEHPEMTAGGARSLSPRCFTRLMTTHTDLRPFGETVYHVRNKGFKLLMACPCTSKSPASPMVVRQSSSSRLSEAEL